MASRREYKMESTNPWAVVLGLLVFVLILVGLFWIARIFFTLLYYASPFLLLATLFLDRKVILNYIQWLSGLVKRNALLGILAIVLSLVGFPVVSGYLFVRALLNWRLRKMEKEVESRQRGEYVDFEELQSPDELDLDPPSRAERRRDEDERDRLFD